jgi:hypothetical protein
MRTEPLFALALFLILLAAPAIAGTKEDIQTGLRCYFNMNETGPAQYRYSSVFNNAYYLEDISVSHITRFGTIGNYSVGNFSINDAYNWLTSDKCGILNFDEVNSWTIRLILNISKFQNYDIFMGEGRALASNMDNQYYVGADGILHYEICKRAAGCGTCTGAAPSALTANNSYTFYHTYDATSKNHSFYLNGSFFSSCIDSQTYGKTDLTYLFLGTRTDQAYSAPNTHIGGVAMWNRSLNQVEITYDYQGGIRREYPEPEETHTLSWSPYPPNITLEKGQTILIKENASCSLGDIDNYGINEPWPELSWVNGQGLLTNSSFGVNRGFYNASIWATDTAGNLLNGSFWINLTCAPSWACSSYGSCNSSDIAPCISVTDGFCSDTYMGDLSIYDNNSCSCAPSWACSSYGSCNGTSGIISCINVTDHLCFHTYTGNISAFDGICQKSRIAATDEILILLAIGVFFWVAMLTLTFTFRSFALTSMMWLSGVVLGLFFAGNFNIMIGFGFMLLSTMIFLWVASRQS